MTESRPETGADADEIRDAPPAAGQSGARGAVGAPPVPSPGFINDQDGHIAVSTNAAAGTSEELPAVQAATATALAQPGKPDGEVAT